MPPPINVVLAGELTARPVHGTPEWNAAFDAARKTMGYPSRQELAAFDRRFPVYDADKAQAAQRMAAE